MEEKFQLGDTVRHKAGTGELMAVKYIVGGEKIIEKYEEIATKNKHSKGDILCTWMSGEKKIDMWLEPYLLEKDDGSPIAPIFG